MSEKPEKVHVVLRGRLGVSARVQYLPVKVADDRADARRYAVRMNVRAKRYHYTVRSCPKL